MNRMQNILTSVATGDMLATSPSCAMVGGAKIFVIGGKAGDPFRPIVKHSAEDAGYDRQCRRQQFCNRDHAGRAGDKVTRGGANMDVTILNAIRVGKQALPIARQGYPAVSILPMGMQQWLA